MKVKKDNTAIYISVAIIAYLAILIFFIIGSLNFNTKLVKIAENNQIQYAKLTNELKATKLTSRQIKLFDATNDKIYQDFTIQYRSTQSDWLNAWLFALTIVLAIMGIILPILNINFFASRKEEMDKIIENAIIQKNQTKLNVDEMAQQLKEVEAKSAEMTKQIAKVKEEFSQELRDIKAYVDESKANAKYAEALNKYSNDKLNESENILNEIIEFKPDYDNAYALLSSIYSKRKNYSRAKEYVNKAIEYKPDNIIYYNSLAFYCTQLEDFDSAIANIDKSIALKPNKEYPYSLKAIICSKKKDVDGTNTNINKAISTNPTDTIVWNNCGLASFNIDDIEKSIEFYNKSLSIKPTATAYYNITEAYIFNNQLKNALDNLKKYISIAKPNKTMYGIYIDDYEKWTKKINTLEQNPLTKELLELIETLEKRPRKEQNTEEED